MDKSYCQTFWMNTVTVGSQQSLCSKCIVDSMGLISWFCWGAAGFAPCTMRSVMDALCGSWWKFLRAMHSLLIQWTRIGCSDHTQKNFHFYPVVTVDSPEGHSDVDAEKLLNPGNACFDTLSSGSKRFPVKAAFSLLIFSTVLKQMSQWCRSWPKT